MNTLTGTVVKRSGDKTVSVEVTRVSHHPMYGKKTGTSKKYLVHDPDNKAEVDQVVTIKESRPRSKRKRWTIVYDS